MTADEVFAVLVALLPPDPPPDGPDHPEPVSARERGLQPGWRRRASCRGTNPELFHPPVGAQAEILAAIAVCDGCPVRLDCLATAMATPIEQRGVWGGLTARERRGLAVKVRRRQRPAAA